MADAEATTKCGFLRNFWLNVSAPNFLTRINAALCNIVYFSKLANVRSKYILCKKQGKGAILRLHRGMIAMRTRDEERVKEGTTTAELTFLLSCIIVMMAAATLQCILELQRPPRVQIPTSIWQIKKDQLLDLFALHF